MSIFADARVDDGPGRGAPTRPGSPPSRGGGRRRTRPCPRSRRRGAEPDRRPAAVRPDLDERRARARPGRVECGGMQRVALVRRHEALRRQSWRARRRSEHAIDGRARGDAPTQADGKMARCKEPSTISSPCSTSRRSRSTSSAAARPTRTASGCSAARSPGRRWSPRARTVDDPTRSVHSLHAYFLRPGDPTVPILYEVDRIRDGRSFTTRRVVAIQHGRAIFNLQASFHVDEAGPDHQIADADRACRPPETLPDCTTRMAPYADQLGELVRPAAPDRPALHRRRPDQPQGHAVGRASRCGCAPTASSPTTRCCTPASSPTPAT